MRRLVFAVASLTFLLVGSSSSFAEAPWRVGWWTAKNPGLPSLVGGVEFPNNVPDGGFEIEGNADSPTSIAALLYDVPDGAIVGPLVITVADDVPPAPGTTVQACPLVDVNFKSDDGAPMSEAPEWDCSDPSLGTIDPTGESFSFDVARFVEDEQLAVAIVPAASAQAVFAPPDDDSLEVRESSRSTTPSASPAPSRPSRRAATPSPPDAVSFPPLQVPQVETPVAPPVDLNPPVTDVMSTDSAVNVNIAGDDDLGAGSAAIGSIIVGALGCLVWARARRALDTAIGVNDVPPPVADVER